MASPCQSNRVLHSLFPAGPISLSRLFQLPPVEQRCPARWWLPHLPGGGDGADPTVQRDELFPSGAITRCRRQRCCRRSASVGLGRKMIARLCLQDSVCELSEGICFGPGWFEAAFSVSRRALTGVRPRAAMVQSFILRPHPSCCR